MTTITITPTVHDRIYGLCVDNLVPVPVLAGTTATWTPDLSPADLATVNDLVAMANAGITLTLAEYQSIKPDLAGLRTYQGIASPTLVQTVSAVKAQSRVIRVMLRDG